MNITDPILPTGQWIFVHNLASCADGTAKGAVALAKRAGCRGLLVKWSDGGSLYAAGGARSLIEAARAAQLDVIPWGYVYPGDGANVAKVLAQVRAVVGHTLFVLDAETEFDTSPASVAEDLFTALEVTGLQFLYTSLPWPSTQPRFPWATFQAKAAGYLPQLYPWDLAGGTEAPSAEWVGHCWQKGTMEWAKLEPAKPTVPIGAVRSGRLGQQAGSAVDAGFPTMAWWLLDGLSVAEADALARTPFATRPAESTPAAPVTAPGAQSALAQANAQLAAYKAAAEGFIFDLKGRGLVK